MSSIIFETENKEEETDDEDENEEEDKEKEKLIFNSGHWKGEETPLPED